MVCDKEFNENFAQLVLIVSVVSTLFSFFLLFIGVYSRFLETLTSRILIQLAINDIIRTATLLMSIVVKGEIYCKISGVFFSYTLNSSVMWTLYLSSALYRIIKNPNIDILKKYKYWILANYTVLPLLSGLPLITDSYGRVDHLCTLKIDNTGSLWRLFTTYVPVWVALITDIVLYFKTYALTKLKSKNAAKTIITERGFIFIILILLEFIPFSVIRLIQLKSNNCNIVIFSGVSELIISLHGILNTLALLLNRKFVRLVKRSYSNKIEYIQDSDISVTLFNDDSKI